MRLSLLGNLFFVIICNIMKHTVIITAGGIGKRMGGDIPKQFLLLAEKPVLMHAIERFYQFDNHAQIILTLPNEWKDYKNFNKKMLSHHSIEKDFTEETGIEWFCPEPYGNIYTETTGEYKACCTGAEFYEVTTDTHTPIEAMNCAKAKELRN